MLFGFKMKTMISSDSDNYFWGKQYINIAEIGKQCMELCKEWVLHVDFNIVLFEI